MPLKRLRLVSADAVDDLRWDLLAAQAEQAAAEQRAREAEAIAMELLAEKAKRQADQKAAVKAGRAAAAKARAKKAKEAKQRARWKINAQKSRSKRRQEMGDAEWRLRETTTRGFNRWMASERKRMQSSE